MIENLYDCTIIALSINKDTLIKNLLPTLVQEFPSFPKIIFAQGYTVGDMTEINKFISESKDENLQIIYDNAVYNKGLTISEIRDYFIKKYRITTKYTFITDDDHKYLHDSGNTLMSAIHLMNNHKYFGLISFYSRKKNSIFSFSEENPYLVGVRSGMLVKTALLEGIGFGSKYKIQYWEECYLSTLIYQKGYTIVKSSIPCTFGYKKSGLSKKFREIYGKYLLNVPNSGWEILSNLGLYKFKDKNHYNDAKYVGYCPVGLVEDYYKNYEKLKGESIV